MGQLCEEDVRARWLATASVQWLAKCCARCPEAQVHFQSGKLALQHFAEGGGEQRAASALGSQQAWWAETACLMSGSPSL